MKTIYRPLLALLFLGALTPARAQTADDPSLLTVDRIYNSGEFRQEYLPQIQWIENGEAYLTFEASTSTERALDIVRYSSATHERSIFIPAKSLLVEGNPLRIQSFTLSEDGSKVLFFTNSRPCLAEQYQRQFLGL